MSSYSGSHSSSTRNYQPSHLPPKLLTNHFVPHGASCYNVAGRSDVMMSCGALKTQTALPHYTKYLESKIAAIQEQHQNVMTENTNLNNQVSRAVTRVQELEEALLREKEQRREATRHRTLQTDDELRRKIVTTQHRGVNTFIIEHQEVSSFTESPNTLDSSAQTQTTATATTDTDASMVKEQPQPQPILVDASCDPSPDCVSISKVELDNLESDMRTLRNAVRAKEDQWDQALEREHNYRKHLARLSVELMTARQLSETRYNEMQIILQKLTEKKEELKGVQKDLSIAKKALSKYQSNQSAADSPNIQELSAGDNYEVPENHSTDNQDYSSASKQQRPKTKSSKIQNYIRDSPRDSRVGSRVKEQCSERPGLLTV